MAPAENPARTVRPTRKICLVLALVLALMVGAGAFVLRPAREKPSVGLLTSLPIYWAETGDLGAMLSGDGAPHWARQALEREYILRPLDVLATGKDGKGLGGLRYLLLAQPRALSPEENVALDQWLRAGGRVLLFADPMLTAHSDFALGDKRRPQDVVLLSPLLRHWGLELLFDDEQQAGERVVAAFGTSVPVNLAGHFAMRENAGQNARCVFAPGGVIVRCQVGKGRAVIVADAAVLEASGAGDAGREGALNMLIMQAFIAR